MSYIYIYIYDISSLRVNIHTFYIVIFYTEHTFKIFTVYIMLRHIKKVRPVEQKQLLKTK